MNILKSLMILGICLLVLGNVEAQKLFVDKTFSTGYDKTPNAVVGIPNDNYVFVSTRKALGGVYGDLFYLKGEIFVFLTDHIGNVTKSKVILKDTAQRSFLANDLFLNSDYTLSILGSTLDSIKLLNSLFYARVDTNLNVLDYRTYDFSDGNAELVNFKFTKSGTNIYGAITYYMTPAVPYDHLATKLIKLSELGDVLKTQRMDSSFFGVPKYFYPVAYSMDNGFLGNHISMNGTYVISDTIMNKKSWGYEDLQMMYKIDTNLVLVDTTSGHYQPLSITSADTNLLRVQEMSNIETSEHNYLFGAIHSVKGPSKDYYTSGITKYNMASRKIIKKGVLPFTAGIDGGVQYNAFSKGLVSRFNNVYSLVVNYLMATPYFTIKNYLTVVKYDTAANIQWYKHIGGIEYLNPWQIYVCNDGNVMVLASSYDGNVDNKRDFCIFRLDSTDGKPLSIVNVSEQLRTGIVIYPNPAQEELHIKGAVLGSVASIYNSVGQLMMQETIRSSDQVFSIQQLASGNYLYQINDKNGQKLSSGKWIKR